MLAYLVLIKNALAVDLVSNLNLDDEQRSMAKQLISSITTDLCRCFANAKHSSG
jgi:hypothetical protein